MNARFPVKVIALSITFGLAACGSGGGGGGGGAGAGGGSAGGAAGGSSPNTNAPNGIFDIHYDSGSSCAVAGGLMYDGLPLDPAVWQKKKTEGDCSLYTPWYPFCEGCDDQEHACVDTNVCRARPGSHPVGIVTLTGLNPPSGANPLECTSVTTSSKTSYGCETLPLPPCTPGSAVRLDATGEGAYPAFSIQTQCIAPLKVTTTAVVLDGSKPFTLNWTPGTVADARITLEFDLSHHGSSKGQVRCDVADTGSLTVSATLLKSLIDLGVTGFPWLTITRVVKGKTTVGSGQAQLMLYSDEKLILEVPGVKSCNDNSQCPDGQTCLLGTLMCGIECTKNADCPTGQTCNTATNSCK